MKIAGIDVVSGSVRSRTARPLYALVMLENNRVLSEMHVSQFRLLRMLAREEPDILAVDSVQEIAGNRQELLHFMQHLPPRTRLVQVTGGERMESLSKVAARYNIRFDRLDPNAEARAAAMIAAQGGGAEAVLFENTCDVVVSRHRSIGKGGWSQNRYIRRIHGAVLQKAREIEKQLIDAGLKYEKKESRAFGGASRIAFRVHTPREMIPLSGYRGADVQVRISGRALDRIAYRPLSARPRYLIVGLDPGTTTAYAALHLDGQVAGIGSSRQASMSTTIETLLRLGKPLVIASDVSEMPFSVEKIRRAFKAIAYTPKQDRSVEEKQELTAGYSYANVHERDALAAALDAYRYYRHRLQNIVKRVPAGQDLDEVWAAVMRGVPLGDAIGGETPPSSKEAEAVVPPQETKRDERVISLEVQVKRLREYVEELEKVKREKDEEMAEMQRRLRRERSSRWQQLRRDHEIARRDVIITDLRRRLRREQRHAQGLRKLLEYLREHGTMERSRDLLPLKVLAALTKEGVRGLRAEMGIRPDDVIYLAKTDGWGRSVIRELSDEGIRAVVLSKEHHRKADPLMREAFMEFHLPLLTAEEVGAVVRGRGGTANREKFEAAMRVWDDERRRREKSEKAAMLESIFREYRLEREKEVHGG
ncbi:MAG: DUF460 domain-containing protein [Methanomicrobiales archaeon]|nr:DUF460 domain-containing protein [Methanomicrobiales archaeon]